MAKYELDLPEEFAVESREQSVTVTIANLTDEIIGKLVLHGLRQKVADAAAGAKKFADEHGMTVEAATETLMAKVANRLQAGDWGAERIGATGDPLDRFRIEFVRAHLSPESKAEYDAIASDDQKARREFLLALAAENAEVVDEQAEVLCKIEAERKAAKAKVAVKF